MDQTLKEMTMAVLHNNEIVMDQTADTNTKHGDSNQALNNMRKIYDGLRKKLETEPDSVTIPDCKFLVIATNITLATLERQIRSISASIELYKKLQEIYTEAGTSEENLQIFLEKTDFFGDEISTEEPAESAEKEEPNT